MGRRIEYSSRSYGKYSWKSSQGLNTSGGKQKDVMEKITSVTKQSGVTYFTNC
jgi:hypothetical protein